jgi:hypothetical protein
MVTLTLQVPGIAVKNPRSGGIECKKVESFWRGATGEEHGDRIVALSAFGDGGNQPVDLAVNFLALLVEGRLSGPILGALDNPSLQPSWRIRQERRRQFA